MTDPRTPRPTPPPYLWLSVAGAVVGIVLLALRAATLPPGGMAALLAGVAVALAVTVGILAGMALRIRSLVRATADAYPRAVVVPIVVGTATSVASRWLAARFAQPALHLRPSRRAALALDAAGLHVVSSARGPHGHVPADAVSLGPLGRTIVGLREVDAVVLEVAVAELTAPFSFVPMRLRGAPWSPLSDAELLAVTARIEDALAGRAVSAGWGY